MRKIVRAAIVSAVVVVVLAATGKKKRETNDMKPEFEPIVVTDEPLPIEGTVFVLNRQDRCDAGGCNARAYSLAAFGSGAPYSGNRESSLLFCGHHFREAESGLIMAGARTVDERGQLHEEQKASKGE
jgi:hypothetical protein